MTPNASPKTTIPPGRLVDIYTQVTFSITHLYLTNCPESLFFPLRDKRDIK